MSQPVSSTRTSVVESALFSAPPTVTVAPSSAVVNPGLVETPSPFSNGHPLTPSATFTTQEVPLDIERDQTPLPFWLILTIAVCAFSIAVIVLVIVIIIVAHKRKHATTSQKGLSHKTSISIKIKVSRKKSASL